MFDIFIIKYFWCLKYPYEPPLSNSDLLLFSACSIICRTAFFRLFARSMSCSRGLKSLCGESFSVTFSSSFSFSSVRDSSLRSSSSCSSSSSSSSSTMGGVVREGGLMARASVFSVCSSRSSFSFRIPHCVRGEKPQSAAGCEVSQCKGFHLKVAEIIMQ